MKTGGGVPGRGTGLRHEVWRDAYVPSAASPGSHPASSVVRTVHVTPRDGATADPVVFFHGWGISPRAYLPGLRRIAAAGHPVTGIALPGFGGSDPLPFWSTSTQRVAAHLTPLVEAVAEEEAETAGARVHLAGHSFGGGVAVALGAARPDLAESVTAICPVGGAAAGLVGPHRMLGGLVADSLHTWTPGAALDLARNLARHPAAVARCAVAAWSADLIGEVQTLSAGQVRTLLSFSHADAVVSPGIFGDLLLPHVTTERVPGRHSWLLTEPHRFAERTLAHLAAGETLTGRTRAA